ncbi:MAG: hypothetical protein P8X86_19710 [Desulfofustis sp.]
MKIWRHPLPLVSPASRLEDTGIPSAVTRHPHCPALGRFGHRLAPDPGCPHRLRVADSGVSSVQVRSLKRNNSMKSFGNSKEKWLKKASTEQESSV